MGKIYFENNNKDKPDVFHSLVELGWADDGNGLRQHHLVGAVGVEVHTGQEGRLRGVSL